MKKVTHKLKEKFVGASIARPCFKGTPKDNKGITLIALIITIIVMMILVAVTVTFTIGENGILSQTKEAKIKQIREQEKEELGAAVLGAIGADLKINFEELDKNLPEGFTGSNGTYISKTGNKFTVNENGEITYEESIEEIEESVTALEDDNNPLTIGAIEDLVELSIAVNNGTTYEGQTITLLTSLDFDNPESYRTQNPETTKYINKEGAEVDVNGDGTIESIKNELTTGLGFVPIGKEAGIDEETEMPIFMSFKGAFDGNGKIINNIYINRPQGYASLFLGVSSNTTIQNLTIKNPEIYGILACGFAISLDINGQSEGVLTIQNCHSVGGKIGSVNENCVSQGAFGIAYIYSIGEVYVVNSTNSSVISGIQSTGIACVNSMARITVENCKNSGATVIEDEEYYQSVIEDDDGALTVGCVFVASPSGAIVNNCSNFGILSEIEGSIAGVIEGSGAIVTNCSNYGELRVLNYKGENINIAGVYRNPGYDMAEGAIGSVTNCKNYGNILVSADTLKSFNISGITLNSDENVSKCVNYGNITVAVMDVTSSMGSNVSGINIGTDNNVSNCLNYGNIAIDSKDGSSIDKRGIGISYRGNIISNCINYGDVIVKDGYITYAIGISEGSNKVINCANYRKFIPKLF